MTTQGFVASHAKDAEFERGLRSFFEYRELGHSDDVEMLEVVLPAGFTTEEVPSVNG